MAYYPNYYPYQTYQPTFSQPQTQQVQNGGFVTVKSIEEARNYPVAPCTTVIFIDENAPYIYTKTKRSQLEQPIFEKMRLVKEEDSPVKPQNEQIKAENDNPIDLSVYALKSELESLRGLYEGLSKEIKEIKGGKDE